jgi:ferrous iron transport protein B
MTFCLLYVPCTATIATIHREVGSAKKTVAIIAYQLATAWVVSFLMYHLVGLFV